MLNFEKIGVFFARFRVSNGYSQQDVAEFIGVCVRTIRNLECGKKCTDSDTIMKLCDLYGISASCLDQFYTRDADMDYAINMYLNSDRGRKRKRGRPIVA